MNHMPDLRDDPRLAGLDAFDSASERHARMIEDQTDALVEQCRDQDFCARLNSDYELGYDDMLPRLMQAVASWTGSSSDSNRAMRALHNILADEMQKLAERGVK